MKNLALHVLSKICPIKNMSHRKSVRRKNVPVPVLLLTHSHRVKTQINPIVIQLYLKSRRRKMGILIRFFVFFVSLDFFDFLPEHRDGLFGQKQLLLQLRVQPRDHQLDGVPDLPDFLVLGGSDRLHVSLHFLAGLMKPLGRV